MAEQIARNSAAWRDEEQVAAKTAEPMAKFWTSEMRQALIDSAQTEELEKFMALSGVSYVQI